MTVSFSSDENGILWATDGTDRIAAAVPARITRFFSQGIAKRCNKVTDRYLQRNLVPIPKGAIVINFGANIGEVAVTLADRGAKVIAIEPDPYVVPALLANAAGRLIDVVPVAAWNADYPVSMYLKTDSADTSAFNVSDCPMELEARRIDTLVKFRGIERVHLIVGDAEGAEPEVLEGARETLKITSYVSVCASAERCGERTLEACEAILKAANFDIIHREDTKFCTLIGRRRAVV